RRPKALRLDCRPGSHHPGRKARAPNVRLAPLGVTAWTGKAAMLSAQAAIDAVGAERAWISQISYGANIAANSSIDGVAYDRAMSFNIGLQNTGRSPAINLSLTTDVVCCRIGDPVPEFSNLIGPSNDDSGVVGPGIQVSAESPWVVGEDLQNFINRTHVLYIHCRACYYTTEAPTVRRMTEFTGQVYCNHYSKNYTSRDGYKDTMVAKGRNTAS
ncbi:hypothetical protein, partial [Methylobacterium sp. Leaf111]|uniref:hypothetical protein n=1 Tax=Methylobacterium sp. Leaf111 TaxID=1736257 RepID=UPI001AEC7093